APPAGTLALAGDGPVQLAVPPATPRSVGETAVSGTLLRTFTVTFTVPPWRTKLLPTVSAVSSTGGPGSLPAVAGVGTYGPNVPRWPTAVGGAVSPVGNGSITRTPSSSSSLPERGSSVYVTLPGSDERNVWSTDLSSVMSSARTRTSALAAVENVAPPRS